ncbi:glycosyltransferase family 2 protein [Methylobacterium sp. BTF04]|uniref:glycosyltransferase family 2 protein n=1 Tax=Methylobacterium sp. BTF04 TaxID=2708300 RepID=UPI0013D8956E|nr:glycosyltransferase family 2 protein [Methylobacterium sp. BTF04]NEU13217.1 glycosyltransferase family 2 protein [Methylobacterium sp. BTF04]
MDYLTACCTAKDEAPIILEWIAFHIAAGFDRLVIIDNGSTDGTPDVIRSFWDQDKIDLIDWPGPGTQVAMYERVAANYRDRTEWLAFIDADEFLYPTEGTDLRETLKAMPNVDGIGVHWHIYGSSGHTEAQPGLVIENYQRRAEPDFIYNRHIKSVVRAAKIVKVYSSHLVAPAAGMVDDVGNELHLGPPYGWYSEKPASHVRLRLNHYHTRSKGEYRTKAMRGYFGVDDEKLATEQRFRDMFEAHDRNEVFDDSAMRFAPEVRASMARLPEI